jgi:hypothetical protein
MQAEIDSLVTSLKPWWPFVVQLITFWFVGQNVKKRILTKRRAASSPIFAMLRDTMWIHPSIAGFLWGLSFPWMPAVEFVTTRGGAVTQGIAAGVLSVVGFRALEAVAAARGWVWLSNVLHEVGTDRVTLENAAGGTHEIEEADPE